MFRNAVIFKWALYLLAALACFALQSVAQCLHLLGVIPFLYPLLAVIPATMDSPGFGGAFAVLMGVICDLLLPESLPCFYTLSFPVSAMIASFLSRELLPAGLLCSYAVSAFAFAVNGFFHCFLLWTWGDPSPWMTGLFLTLREFAVTVPLMSPLMTLLFRLVADRTRYEEMHKGMG
ncbi:MAG: hypothetical protein IJQ81_07020 [Oscillibacter sp.]|nr:hypothetical protein [Oscillibacter sp.]